MRYRVEPLGDWAELDGGDRLRVARHYRVPGDGTDLLLLPHGRPGWVRLTAAQLSLLETLDGATVADTLGRSWFAAIADLVRGLYDNGLLFVGDRTGLRATATADDAAEIGLPPRALLLKLTGACDMACTYCYDYDAERWAGRMSSNTARALVEQCLRPGQALMLMFHGGEPMLRFGQVRELVEHASRRAEDLGAEVRFSIQTNGLHLTRPVIDFFRRNKFAVGVSLDGPRQIHDAARVDHGGRGTFDRLAAIIDRFGSFMREEVGYISVVGPGTDAGRLDETWRFFRALGPTTWKLLPADAEGRAAGSPQTAEFRRVFVDFLSRRLDAVLAGDVDPPYITNLVQLVEPFLTVDRPNMCMKMPCGASSDLLVLDAAGALRSCDSSYDPIFELLPALPAATSSGAMSASGAAPASGDLPLLPIPVVPSSAPPVGPAAADSPRAFDPLAPSATDGLLAQLRSSESARTLRARESWLLTEAPCATCAWLHQCAGTCPARALNAKGSVFAIDDLECETRLDLFPRILADLSRSDSRLRSYYDLARNRAGSTLATTPHRRGDVR